MLYYILIYYIDLLSRELRNLPKMGPKMAPKSSQNGPQNGSKMGASKKTSFWSILGAKTSNLLPEPVQSEAKDGKR